MDKFLIKRGRCTARLGDPARKERPEVAMLDRLTSQIQASYRLLGAMGVQAEEERREKVGLLLDFEK